jgi:hypothetical protein
MHIGQCIWWASVSKTLSFLELYNVWIDNWMCINISASSLAKGYDSGPREKGDPNRKPWLAKMIFQVHKG